VVPFQQNKPVVSNNVTNIGNATGIIHPGGGSKHTSPIATGSSNSDGASRSDGKTSNGSNPISKGIPSDNNKINEMKNRITQNLEKHLRKSG
jgi:hypothetical protein